MASVRAHLEAGTLERGLPTLDLPALFLFGVGDPLPPSTSLETAALIHGALIQTVQDVIRIQQEGVAHRRAAEKQVEAMRTDLHARLARGAPEAPARIVQGRAS